MYNMPIPQTRIQELLDVLTSDHERAIKVSVLTLDHTFVADISAQFEDGQVNFDADAEVTRSATLALSDPDNTLTTVGTSPTMGKNYLDRMLKIEYQVTGPSQVYTIPIFTGPITSIQRTGAVLDVECQGKEVIAMVPYWYASTFGAAESGSTIITEVLQNVGETRIFVNAFTRYLGTLAHCTKLDTAWGFAKEVARRTGATLAYDGDGWLWITTLDNTSVWTFSDTTRPSLLSAPITKHEDEELINTVVVLGKTSPGSSKTVYAEATLPSTHNLAPVNLRRNSTEEPRFLVETIQTDLTSSAACQARADSRIAELSAAENSTTFTALPMPLLEPNDLCTLDSNGVQTNFRLKKFSIPLNNEGVMTVDFNSIVWRQK